MHSGATIAVNVVIKILEHNSPALGPAPHPSAHLPKPRALVLNYAALDFNFTSWMSPAHLRVLRSEQSSGNLPGIRGLAAQKDHLQHISPLSMVGDKRPRMPRKRLRRRTSWRDTLRGLTSPNEDEDGEERERVPFLTTRASTGAVQTRALPGVVRRGMSQPFPSNGDLADAESEEDFEDWREEDRPIEARVRYVYRPSPPASASGQGSQGSLRLTPSPTATVRGEDNPVIGNGNEPIGTRLTMTSRTGYFQDRVISPSMVRTLFGVLCG